MNKSIRSFLGPQSLESILKPLNDKLQELTVFATNNRAAAVAKRQAAEALQREAEHMEAEANLADSVAERIARVL